MATLVVHAAGAAPSFVTLVKPLTTLAAAPDSDVRVPNLRGVVAIEFDGESFTATALEGAQLVVNGKRRGQHTLADGDTMELGSTQLVFQSGERVPAPAQVQRNEQRDPQSLATARLAEFARQLASEPGVDTALTRLLDALIEVVRADKGFVLVVNEGTPQVLKARNFQRENVADAVERLSDTIVRRVLETRQPLCIEDALHDSQFNASESVVNLKLASVMCLPLVMRGELLGAIYVGNDKLTNLFTDRELEVATSFCSTAVLLVELGRQLDELRADKRALLERLEEHAYGDIIGACEAMRDIFRKIDKVAGTDISVLVTGETGTGKELIAREIHRRSPRKNGPFVAINCGAIPETLLESELFGHAKGAFTGAVASRPGRFQAAHGGTLFLDEIGEMPAALQVKLLRALQEHAVTRVGENKAEPVDIRVVAATNKDLDEEMKGGRFREDLYYRVNVVQLHLPPLHDRGEDAVTLAKWFLGRAARELGSKVKGFSPQALVAIKRFRWPGNIRQLENRIKKAVVLAEKPLISPDDLELRPEQLEPILALAEARDEWQKRYINEVLERNGGNRTKTAKDLGVDPRTIFRHLERMEAEKRGETLPPDEALDEQ
ncbi:MAG: Fis family transcriptional regulator [Deltaproteobacteria bacterium 13_1_20CM_2_69_21]|nr:MAG: Fis family transcriptional regulator [Deltaproteobacteria bacterium 13_1_40CM_3_69_14]OLD47085.1 MAG: Fis family transcriptional regulator [Chloroflexi bacterium 13_1_40CM_2_68_14]OLE61949.1 MAG: Fis family transcriptional regulator [Deltaproteobacteria bacterium 13_1_20CM_2_69_21]